jgi:hypothetical protein
MESVQTEFSFVNRDAVTGAIELFCPMSGEHLGTRKGVPSCVSVVLARSAQPRARALTLGIVRFIPSRVSKNSVKAFPVSNAENNQGISNQ